MTLQVIKDMEYNRQDVTIGLDLDVILFMQLVRSKINEKITDESKEITSNRLINHMMVNGMYSDDVIFIDGEETFTISQLVESTVNDFKNALKNDSLISEEKVCEYCFEYMVRPFSNQKDYKTMQELVNDQELYFTGLGDSKEILNRDILARNCLDSIILRIPHLTAMRAYDTELFREARNYILAKIANVLPERVTEEISKEVE